MDPKSSFRDEDVGRFTVDDRGFDLGGFGVELAIENLELLGSPEGVGSDGNDDNEDKNKAEMQTAPTSFEVFGDVDLSHDRYPERIVLFNAGIAKGGSRVFPDLGWPFRAGFVKCHRE